jgi:histidinol-phosphate/aromatic aminotransferase/cobyric acid decarboxylase-like protein
MPQPKLAAAMLSQRIDIGRAHPSYANWARITIGLPEENQRAQVALRLALKEPWRTAPAPRNESRSRCPPCHH